MEDLPSNASELSWLPAWIHRVGVPVWISDPHRAICFVNDRGELLFERGVAACAGQPCYQVVAGRDVAGRPFCSARCPLLCSTNRGDVLEPFVLHVGDAATGGQRIRVQCVPLTAPDGSGPWIVHLAWPIDRERRMEEFLTRVALRTPSGPGGRSWRLSTLTPREREVLAHLADDEDFPTIAARLHVSHATVRNHVQHILAKLDAHSTLEAIALYLLRRDPRSARGARE